MKVKRIVSFTMRIGLLAGLACGLAATGAHAQTFGPGAAMNLTSGTVQRSTISVGSAGTVTSVSVELDGVAATGSSGDCCFGLQVTWFILSLRQGRNWC